MQRVITPYLVVSGGSCVVILLPVLLTRVGESIVASSEGGGGVSAADGVLRIVSDETVNRFTLECAD